MTETLIQQKESAQRIKREDEENAKRKKATYNVIKELQDLISLRHIKAEDFATVYKKNKYGIPEGFLERDTEEIRADAQEVINQLLEGFSEIPSITTKESKQKTVENKDSLSEYVTEDALNASLASLEKDGYLEGQVETPNFQEVLDSFNKITETQIEEIQKMEQPIFYLVPIPSGKKHLDAMNTTLPYENQYTAYVDDHFSKALREEDQEDKTENEKIIGFIPHIAEGVQNPQVPEWADLGNTTEERWESSGKYAKEKGLSRLRSKDMMVLSKLALCNDPDSPLSTDIWTPTRRLKDKGFVAGTFFDETESRINLDAIHTNSKINNVRFRFAVKGKVLSA